MSKHDDASWHYGGDYPAGLPRENASTHIGMFLAWCINNDLVSDLHLEECAEDIARVKNRELTGAEFLINNCDEQFTDEDLDETGNAFAIAYYRYGDETEFARQYANYLQDYARVLNNASVENDLYRVADTWSNYDLLKPVMDQRFAEWKTFDTNK